MGFAFEPGLRRAGGAPWLAPLLLAACSFTPASAVLDGAGPGSDAASAGADAADADAGTGPGAADAPLTDAPIGPAPDAIVGLCPIGYEAVPGLPSRYRWIEDKRTMGEQHRDCADDLPGQTHLAILDTAGERAVLSALHVGSWTWVGLVQLPGQSSASAGWRWLDDTMLNTTLAPWADFPNVNREPNDDEGFGLVFETNEENAAVLDAVDGLVDVRFSNVERAICECDGRGIVPAIGGLIP
jgi:hypothetical protein